MLQRGARFVGYAREASSAQTLSEQIEALRRAGCHDDNIWTDKFGDRRCPQLQLALIDARKGDLLIVPRYNSLSSSFKHVSLVLKELQSRQVHLYVLEGQIDTRGKYGHLAIAGLLSMIELKRSMKSEETKDGLAAARMRGRLGGRPASLSAHKIAMARELMDDRKYTMADVAERLGVSRSTLYHKGLKRCRRVSSPAATPFGQSSNKK